MGCEFPKGLSDKAVLKDYNRHDGYQQVLFLCVIEWGTEEVNL